MQLVMASYNAGNVGISSIMHRAKAFRVFHFGILENFVFFLHSQYCSLCVRQDLHPLYKNAA